MGGGDTLAMPVYRYIDCMVIHVEFLSLITQHPGVELVTGPTVFSHGIRHVHADPTHFAIFPYLEKLAQAQAVNKPILQHLLPSHCRINELFHPFQLLRLWPRDFSHSRGN